MSNKEIKFTHYSQELGLSFPDEDAFKEALSILEKLRSEELIQAHPIGGVGERFIVMPQWMQSKLPPLLGAQGVKFTPLVVRSLGELTREQRIELRRTGRRIG